MSDTATDVFAPRTYQTAWQFNGDSTPRLVTAEEWLNNEADVHAAMEQDDAPSDGPSTAGALRAIAKEIAQLRVERTQWANECTRLAKLVTP